ncbi:MAG: Na+/H+ antiporter NhaC [Nannocystaceae bacterium]|nr:Na+/H+ antiporter NhaC [bacterium]
MNDDERVPDGQPIPGWAALVPIVALVGFLSLFILVLPGRYPGFEGTGHLPLILAAVTGGIVARAYGWSWKTLQHGIDKAIGMAMSAMLILLVIGLLMGTWLVSGVVPALVDWGLSLLSPSFFLPTACAVCSVVSLVSGSSWSTAGTVGIAMIGIGGALGIDPAMTAGAVISGAYFGDKLSPMSDTTNLAPAMAGAELFEHIRHQMLTTGPSWVIAMIVYTVLSLGTDVTVDSNEVEAIQAAIRQGYAPGLVHVIPPAVVLLFVLRRMPALPTLLLGAGLGAVLALGQGTGADAVITSALSGHAAQTGNAGVDDLLSRGGMLEMSSTVILILCAMSFGGVMERTGMLQTLANTLLRLAKSTGSLIAVTVLTAAGINVVSGDQYISIVVPGRMYGTAFAERGLHPKNLSRALEDGGTITSALIPWNTCGAFMSATLMVSTGAYLPYAVLNYVNPLLSILFGFLGITIAKRQSVAP